MLIFRFNKRYLVSEIELRFDTFLSNLKLIEEKRQKHPNVNFEINFFADLTLDELYKVFCFNIFPTKITFFLQYIMPHNSKRKRESYFVPLKKDMSIYEHLTRPDAFDWRKRGVVTATKNQGQCGSCWAFAVTATVESLYAIHTGKLLRLSEQQLLDCDLEDSACDGGYRPNAFK